MDLDRIFKGMAVSGSGMEAERRRLDVIAQNIANANSLQGPDGGPYRRRNVIFETVLEKASGDEATDGVRIADISEDTETPFREVFDKNHPLADEKGIVKYPNVNMAFEMIDMMTAARSYEANLKAVGVYRDMMRQSLRLLEN